MAKRVDHLLLYPGEDAGALDAALHGDVYAVLLSPDVRDVVGCPLWETIQRRLCKQHPGALSLRLAENVKAFVTHAAAPPVAYTLAALADELAKAGNNDIARRLRLVA